MTTDTICIVTYKGMKLSNNMATTDYKGNYVNLAEYYKYLGEEQAMRLVQNFTPMVRKSVHEYIDMMLSTVSLDEWSESYIVVQDEFGNIIANKQLLDAVPMLETLANIMDRI